MTGFLIALGVILVAAMGVGCIVLEIRLAKGAHPARFFLCWAAWGFTATVAVSLPMLGAGMPAGGAIFGGLVVGASCYPVIWARFRLSIWPQEAVLRAREQDLERLRYRAVDFGGAAKPLPDPRPALAAATGPAKPAPDAAPLTPLPLNTALAEASADRRPTWARAVEQGLVAVISVCGMVIFIVFAILDGDGYRSDAGAPEAVAELLEMNGFAAPKVERRMLAIHCYQSFAYSWTAMGAEGRACVNYYDGEIEVKIDRTWERTPPPMS